MEQPSYIEVYKWAYKQASKILKEERDDRRLRSLYYAIRGEETPGRFYNSLARELGDLRFASELKVSGKEDLLTCVQGDSFYLVKAAIILALVNASGTDGAGATTQTADTTGSSGEETAANQTAGSSGKEGVGDDRGQ